MNEYVVAVLDAATNPDVVSDEAERVRERLRHAGLLSETPPRPTRPPDRAALERARARAGRGTPLSDIVTASAVTLFADSSAIVKRYANEIDHEVIRSISEALVVSTIARVEVQSALWRKGRLGELTDDEVAVLTDDFESDWWGTDSRDPAFIAVGVTDLVLDLAVGQVARHGLRAYDAVQLASAMSAREAEPSVTTLACFDVELRTAAVREGFTLLPAKPRGVRRR